VNTGNSFKKPATCADCNSTTNVCFRQRFAALFTPKTVPEKIAPGLILNMYMPTIMAMGIVMPMVGSRLTNQISPRFGLEANEVSTTHACRFVIAGVAVKQLSSLLTQDSTAFRQSQTHEGDTVSLLQCNLFCSFTNSC
jgi:hypothetical protein